MYRKKEWDSGANRFQVVPSDDPVYPEGDFRASEPALDQPMPETRAPLRRNRLPPRRPPPHWQAGGRASLAAAKSRSARWRPLPSARQPGSATTGGRSAASRSRPTTPTCRHTTPRSPQKSPATSPASWSTTTRRVHAGDVIATHRRRRLPPCRRLRARQGRDPGSDHRAHRPSGRRPGSRRRPGQGAARFGQAGATRMELELDRQNTLAAQDFASRQALEQAQANRDQAVAAVQSAQAALDSAAANVDVLKGQQQEAVGTLESSRPRSPRPSAICRSPSSARRSTA